jgi:hypothetical protein
MRWLAIAVAVLAAIGAVLAVVLGARGGFGSSEVTEPTGPQPPVAIAPTPSVEPQNAPEPSKTPPQSPPPEAEKPVEAKPAAPGVGVLDAAPGKFTLGREHRLYLDRFHALPPLAMRIEMDAPFRVIFQGDALEGLRRRQVDLPVFLFTRTAKGLEARPVQGTWQWSGTTGWLLSMRSAHLQLKTVTVPTAWDKKALMHAKTVRSPSASDAESDTPEIDMAAVESTNQYRVRSLAAANTWRLTLTPKAESGKSLFPLVLGVMPRPPLTRDVFLDGKPLESTMTLLTPGAHKLFGADQLWLSMIAYEGANPVDVDVELTALPNEPEPSLKQRGIDANEATFQRDKQYKQGGAWRCERITAVLPAGSTLAKKPQPLLEVQFKDAPPLLIEMPAPIENKTKLAGQTQTTIDLTEAVRRQLRECQSAVRLLRAARLKLNATVETTAGKRTGWYVRYTDIVGH